MPSLQMSLLMTQSMFHNIKVNSILFNGISTFGLSPDEKNVYVHRNWDHHIMLNDKDIFVELTRIKGETLRFLRNFGENNYIVVMQLVDAVGLNQTSIEGSLEDPMVKVSMDVNFETRNLEYANINGLEYSKELTLPYASKSEYDYIIVDYNLNVSKHLSISISEESDNEDDQTVISIDLDEKGVRELEDVIRKWRESKNKIPESEELVFPPTDGFPY
jgi:hypothetical protein